MDVDTLYRRYGPMVMRRCRQLLRDEDQALDATPRRVCAAIDAARPPAG